jgi:alpha-1,2-mannosyltransferase
VTIHFSAPSRAGDRAVLLPAKPASLLVGSGPGWLLGRPATPRSRALLVAVNLAALTFFLLSFSQHGVGFGPYLIDLDVYRIGGRVWLGGGNLYGVLPATAAEIRLPFSYPPIAAVLLSPLSLVPTAVAGTVLTLATVALTALVLRVFLRSAGGWAGGLAGRLDGAWSWWTVGWLLPTALFLEPVRNTLSYGQVNVALMALVSVDCLSARARWPRGALVGVAAAVKLTPGAFVLFFLLRRDYRAAATAAASGLVATGAGFLLAPGDSARYWTSVIVQTGRPGSPVYAANQSIQGVLARAGLDQHTPTGAAAWLALSAVVLALACLGMRRALATSADAWALSLNAFAALLISPISWSHHWVWGETAVLALAMLGRRQRRRGGLIAAACGLTVFAAAPQWWFPSGGNRELHWAAWQQVIGDSYVIFASVMLLLSARNGVCYRPIRDISWAHRSYWAKAMGFGGTLWLRDTRCGSVTPSGKPRRPSYASTSPADGSTRTS